MSFLQLPSTSVPAQGQYTPAFQHRAQPYVLIPDRLIEAHVRDPLAVGVYVAVARLALIHKGPVPLSATELALWMGSDIEADRVAIMRRITKLERGGWLLVSRETAYKHSLLPSWGADRNGQPRPWDFAQVGTGRPEHLRGRRVPLQLLDTTMGQLKPQHGRAPAIINRYLTHPLLDLADIGTYAIRLRTLVPPTARLAHLDLTTETLPSQRSLLKLAADGMLTTLIGDTPTSVSLTAWGYDHLGIVPPMPTLTSDEQVCRSLGRSLSRSPESRDHELDITLPDALKHPSVDANARNAWDVGIKESINNESPPNMIDSQGGGAPDLVHDREGATLRSAHHQSTIAIPDQLSPQIIAAHQALNPGREIIPGEWWELLDIQQAHGPEQLLIWQARALRAPRHRPQGISPDYYTVCALQTVIGAYRPRPAPLKAPCIEIGASGPALPSSCDVPPPKSPLAPECDALLSAMGIRERDSLGGVPLTLIQKWQAVIDHPGLSARFDDVRAFTHSQLTKHQPPPPPNELERWALRARERAATLSPPALTSEQLAQIHARNTAMMARVDALAPPDLTDHERLMLMADVHKGLTDQDVLSRLHQRREAALAPPPSPPEVCQQLLERLRQPMYRPLWALLERITLQPDGEVLRIVCRQVADLGMVEAELARRVRGLLPQYSWQPTVQVVAQAPPPPPSDPPSAPPDWIRPEQWARLPRLLRTALLGATFVDGAVQCISPALTALVQTRFAHHLEALLAEVHDGG